MSIWIKCEDRLPKLIDITNTNSSFKQSSEKVLVTAFNKKLNLKQVYEEFYTNEGWYPPLPRNYEIIAWMKMPKPFEEKK